MYDPFDVDEDLSLNDGIPDTSLEFRTAGDALAYLEAFTKASEYVYVWYACGTTQEQVCHTYSGADTFRICGRTEIRQLAKLVAPEHKVYCIDLTTPPNVIVICDRVLQAVLEDSACHPDRLSLITYLYEKGHLVFVDPNSTTNTLLEESKQDGSPN